MTVITISRQYGSGGRKIAAHIAEMLGYRFFDKRFMAQIAADVGLSDQEIVDFSEENYKTKTFFEQVRNMVGQPNIVAEITMRERDPSGREVQITRKLDELQAVDLVRAAVRAAYERGNVVIVGRGGQVILRDMEDVFHVRVVAPMTMRRKRLEQFEGISATQAGIIAAERDEANYEYFRRFFNENLDNPLLYDMIINTGKWSVDDTSDMIIHAIEKKHAAVASG
jgi:cytidylate kinase